MSPEKKRAMIKRDHPELSISPQCKLVRLSRSAFYYTPVGIDADTLALMKEIDRVFIKYPFFGSRQIAAYLRREGTIVGRHRVSRLIVTSREVVWLFFEQHRSEFVPVLHRLQGRSGCQC